MKTETTEEKIWIDLANLFFLDTAPDETELNKVVFLL